MDKNQIYEYLNNNNIKYEISEHIAVYNMEEAYDIKLPYPNASAKNLFIRDNKKQNYYLRLWMYHPLHLKEFLMSLKKHY